MSYVRCECDLWGCVRQRRVIIRTLTSGRAVPLVGGAMVRRALGDGGAARHGAIQGSSYLGILNPQPAQVLTVQRCSVPQ